MATAIAVLQFMMAHKRLSLFEALQALLDDNFGDENTGGISTDEEDDLDRHLGLTDGVSRQVLNVFYKAFRGLHVLTFHGECVPQTDLNTPIFLVYTLRMFSNTRSK